MNYVRLHNSLLHLIIKIFVGVLHGDISLETLEKEINNPNIAAHSREIIANVLYEFSNSGRNPSQQKLTYPNGIQIPMKMHSVFNKNTFEGESKIELFFELFKICRFLCF